MVEFKINKADKQGKIILNKLTRGQVLTVINALKAYAEDGSPIADEMAEIIIESVKQTEWADLVKA